MLFYLLLKSFLALKNFHFSYLLGFNCILGVSFEICSFVILFVTLLNDAGDKAMVMNAEMLKFKLEAVKKLCPGLGPETPGVKVIKPVSLCISFAYNPQFSARPAGLLAVEYFK